MERDKITLCKQFIKGYIFHEILKRRILVHIISDDTHSEAFADAAHSGSDLSGSDNTGGLLIEVHTAQSFKAVVILADFVISLIKPSVNGKCESHGKLGHGFG